MDKKISTMKRTAVAALAMTAFFASSPSHAEMKLIAIGALTGSTAGANADLSNLAGKLENGLPADVLGGFGSGLGYAGHGVFVAVPDRGPNATPYNPAVDDTVSFISRFHSLTMPLVPAAAGAALPFSMTPKLTATTLLWSSMPLVYGDGAGLNLGTGAPPQNTYERFYFTGRSDNYDSKRPSTFPGNGRLDPESIRVSGDGSSVFVSDEYGPFVYQFDRQTGRRVKAFALPADLATTVLSPLGAAEIAKSTQGRTANKGMEGLAVTPDGKRLVGMMQAALLQDAAVSATKKLVRFVSIDIASGATQEFGYLLTEGSGVSDIVAINNHAYLVDERDGAGLGDGSKAVVKKLFRINLEGATDISGLTGAAASAAAVKKVEVLDLVRTLGNQGIPPDKVPAKIEGIAFGPDVTVNGAVQHTLFVANDNDFLPDTAGPNQIFVFGFTDADIPGYVQQSFKD